MLGGSRERSRQREDTMGFANGVHHLAICTNDIKGQIEFFTDVLGCELKALYWMHGVEGAWHGFLELNASSYIAFVQTPAMGEIEPVWGVSHAANPGSPAAPGTMQHVAFSVETKDELFAIRDRIRSRGVNVYGPIEHGMCSSIYFGGPEGLNLEVAWSAAAIDARAWIDPEVQALAGISDEELTAFVSPAPYRGEGGAVVNPPIDPAKPHVRYPEKVYQYLMTTPDDVLTERMSFTEPPVKID
jgi:catechol 2,3-dioxygenase-like lactoylglutathione lyase family enzyme